MRLLSRFKKRSEDGEQDESDLPQADVDGEDEGLLMPAGFAAGVDAGGEPPAAATAQSALPRAIDADPDPGEPGSSPEPNADAPGVEQDGDPADALAEEPAPEEAAAEDDPLSAFAEPVVSSELTALTDGIEDVAIADLVEQVREVRAMLPAAPAEDEDVAA